MYMVAGDLFQDSGVRDKVSFKAMVSEYLRYWYVFVIGVVICLGAAFFKIRYTVPEYYVSSTVLIKDQSDGTGLSSASPLAEMEMFQKTRTIEDEIIILKSKSLMERVLRELSFNTTYFLEGRVEDMEVYQHDLPIKLVIKELHSGSYGKKIIIYPEQNNSFQLGEVNADGSITLSRYNFGEQIEKSYAVFTVIEAGESPASRMREKLIVVFHDVENLASYYSNNLDVSPVNKSSNVLNVGLKDPVWRKSIDILNKLIEVYEKEAVEDKNVLASSTLEFIDERLGYLTAELSNVEKNVELYKIKNDLTDVTSETQMYLKSADDYNKQLAEFEIQIDLLASIEDYVVKNSNKEGLVPSSLNIQDPTLVVLIAKFNELQMEKQRMLRTTLPDNPLIHNMNDQLNNLRNNIGENIRNIKNALIITRDNLISSSAKFAYRKKKVPAMERQLLEINRQQGVKEGLYLYLLQKREEAALSLAASVSNFRTIDAPRVIYPIEANKPITYTIALLFGLVLPFSFLYLRNLLNDKVRDVKDIERATSTPVLGEVTRSAGKEAVVVTRDAISPIVEMFRLIRTNLQFATLGKPNKVILITSTMSGEGKSFFSMNIAASLVLTGKKVVVLGMDLRKPSLQKAVNLPDGPGITNFLISDAVSVNEIVKPSNILPDLFVIGSGPVMPCPTELMMSDRVGLLLNTLKGSFDHIIIDSAPIGLVADAFTLAPYIDSTIYMVRNDYTPKECLSIIDKIYREKKLKYPMIVLNYTRVGKGKKYGYGYGYNYKKTKSKVKPASKKVLQNNEVVLSVK